MSLRLPSFQSGRPLLEQVTADKLNQLVDAIRQCELNSGVGYDVNKNSGGATLTIRQQGHQYVQGGDSAKKLIGPSNSGMSHTDASVVVNPGVESYNFYAKTPTGSYTTAFVHGENRGTSGTYNTSSNHKVKTLQTYALRSQTGIVTTSTDFYRRIGLLSAFQATAYTLTTGDTTKYASECESIIDQGKTHPSTVVDGQRFIFDGSANFNGGISMGGYTSYGTTAGSNQTICSGTTYYIQSFPAISVHINRFYYSESASFNCAGNFFRDTGNTSETSFPSGNYSFKRIFNLGSISSSSAKIRVKIRIGQGSFISVKLNGQNATYSSFETQTSTLVPIEITDGFISGQNELEVIVSSTSSTIYPSVSFEFLPTTATIVTTQGFSILTDAQKDLIGNGTPVQVTVGTTNSIYAYDGSGDKGTTASYTFLRDV